MYIIVSQNTDARNLRFGIWNRLAVLHPEKIDHRDDLHYLYHKIGNFIIVIKTFLLQ